MSLLLQNTFELKRNKSFYKTIQDSRIIPGRLEKNYDSMKTYGGLTVVAGSYLNLWDVNRMPSWRKLLLQNKPRSKIAKTISFD